jgi:hypothetical protein
MYDKSNLKYVKKKKEKIKIMETIYNLILNFNANNVHHLTASTIGQDNRKIG